MGMLERLSDARGTLEGKIVAVVLAILLVLPVATVTAFANSDAEEKAKEETKTEEVVEKKDAGAESVVKEELQETKADAPALVNEVEPQLYEVAVTLAPGTRINPDGIGLAEASCVLPAWNTQDFKFEAFTFPYYGPCKVTYNKKDLKPVSGFSYVIPQADLTNKGTLVIEKASTPDPDEGKDPGTNPGEGEGNEGTDTPGQDDNDYISMTIRYNDVPGQNTFVGDSQIFYKNGSDQTYSIPEEYQASNPGNVMGKDGWFFTGWSTVKKDGPGEFVGTTVTIPGDFLKWSTDDHAFELYPCYDAKPLTYSVTYEWNDVFAEESACAGPDGKPVEVKLPVDNGAYEAGEQFKVDGNYNANTQVTETQKDGTKVVYRFSGWKINGQKVEGNSEQTINGNVKLTGEWEKLTYVGKIEAEDWVYDGKTADDKSSAWKANATINGGGYSDEKAEPEKLAYFKAVLDNDTQSYVKAGDALESAPKDAGHYIVEAVWEDKFGSPVAEDCFEIQKRKIEIWGLDAQQTYNGKALSTKDSSDYKSVSPADGIVEGEGFVAVYEKELTNPGNIPNEFTVNPKNGTNKDNYEITLRPGDLKVEGRDDSNKIGLKLIGKSEKVYYNGQEQGTYGLFSVEATDGGITQETVLPADNESTQCTFTFNGRSYELSNYNSGVKATNVLMGDNNSVASYENKIYCNENGYRVTDAQTGEDVTAQFATPEIVSGELTIMPRPVRITTGSDDKVYDKSALTNDVVFAACLIEDDDAYNGKDEVFAAEAEVKTTGTITNVKWNNGEVVGVDNTYEINPIYADGKTAFNRNNYDIKDELGTLTVYPIQLNSLYVKKPADVTYNGQQQVAQPKVYTKAPEEGGVELDASLFEFAYSREPGNSKTYKSDPAQTNMKDVQVTESVSGEVYIQVSGKATIEFDGNVIQNYAGTMPTDFKISPAQATIHVAAASKVYGQDDPKFEVGNIGGLFNDDKLTSDENIQVTRNRDGLEGDAKYDAAGEYKDVLEATVLDESQVNTNYTYTVENGLFSITQANAATVTLSNDNVKKVYDGQPAGLEATINAPEGPAQWRLEYSTDGGTTWSEDNPSFTNVRESEDGSLVNSVIIRAMPNEANRDNFKAPSYASGTVTINPRPITITVNDATKVAGTADPAFDGSITEGSLVEGEDLGLSYYRTNTDEGIGTYEGVLAAEYANEDIVKNYDITMVNGDFTITPMAAPVAPVTPPTPGPLDALVTTVTDFLATPIIGPGAMAAEGIADGETPLAQIGDDETPMSAFDHPVCWIHYYILLGIIITAIYGGGVIARRLGYNHTIKKYEDDVTGESRNSEPLKKPVAKEGTQPTI